MDNYGAGAWIQCGLCGARSAVGMGHVCPTTRQPPARLPSAGSIIGEAVAARRVKELEAEVARLKDSLRWKRPSEALPEPDTTVVVAMDWMDTGYVLVAVWDGCVFRAPNAHEYPAARVAAWMSLPGGWREAGEAEGGAA